MDNWKIVGISRYKSNISTGLRGNKSSQYSGILMSVVGL